MDNLTFNWILQFALLYKQGKTESELCELSDNPKLIKLGIKLAQYLDSLNYSIYQSFENKPLEVVIEKIQEQIKCQ